MDINLEQYRVFYQVGRCGSVTAAAKKLCVSQPAVSQAVRQLERELGSELFVRTPKGVRLTQAGELLYRYVSEGLSSILTGEEAVRRLCSLEDGEVRIGASDMTLRFFLLPFLERFHEAYPGVKVKVTNGPTPETLEILAAGGIDFGVVTTPSQKIPESGWRPVRPVRDCFIAGSRFAELKDRVLRYRELEKLPFICLEKNTSSRRFLDEYLAKRRVSLTPEFELATSDMIVQFAARNLGIGCVAEDFAAEEIQKGHVFALTLEEELPVRQMCVVADSRLSLSPAARRLLEMMAGEEPQTE